MKQNGGVLTKVITVKRVFICLPLNGHFTSSLPKCNKLHCLSLITSNGIFDAEMFYVFFKKVFC